MTDGDKQRLARLLVDAGAVRFGRFQTRSGRISPYFVNLGGVHRGDQLAELAELSARGIGARFAAAPPTCLFGPAYKAIPLAVATAISLTRLLGRAVSYSCNRKEAKPHGEGGVFLGHEPGPADRVLIVDDVVTDGGAKREVIELLRARSQAAIIGLMVTVDRLERGIGAHSALVELQGEFQFPTGALITIEEVVQLAPVAEPHRSTVLAHVARNRAAPQASTATEP